MKFAITFSLFCLTLNFASAQTYSGSVRGKVSDSLGKFPLGFASIHLFLLRDSTIEKKALSDRNGIFEIEKLLLQDSLELVISYTGYKDYHQYILLSSGNVFNIGNIQMRPSAKALDTVLIKAESKPIMVKNDTVEYNASFFKTRPNAIIEELLKKLPGLDVDINGNIMYNGKHVSKILVDGAEFFGNDLLITTRNLPAELVYKIQVMDSKTQEEIFNKLSSSGDEKTINIKLKKVKNNFFGKVGAGFGSNGRHEFTGMANYFDENKKISVIGSDNNINKIGFNNSGGLNVINQGNGITTSKLVGVNYYDKWSDKVQTSGSYFYNNATTSNESFIDRKQLIITDSALTVISKNNQRASSSEHRIEFSVVYTPDSSSNVIISPSVNVRSTANTNISQIFTSNGINEKINESDGGTIDKGNDNTYAIQIFYSRKLNEKGRGFAFAFSGSQNQQSYNAINQSKNIFFQTNIADSVSFINQHVKTNSRGSQLGFSISYIEPINKSIRLILNENIGSGHASSNKNTYDIDSSGHLLNFDSTYSGTFNSSTTTDLTSLVINYSRTKVDISVGATSNFNRLNNYSLMGKIALVQKQYSYSPLAEVNYHISNQANIRLNYTAQMESPSLDQLQPVPDNSNPLAIKIGNPNLKPSFNQIYSINYYLYSPKETISGWFQYSPYANKIVNAVRYDNYGRQTNQYVNVNGIFNLKSNIAFMKAIKNQKNAETVSISLATNYNRDISIVNSRKIITNIINISPRLNIGFSYNDLFTLNCHYDLLHNWVRYSQSTDQQANLIFQTLSNSLTVYFLKDFYFESDLVYSYNNNVPPGFKKVSLLWNIGLERTILKNKKGQVKLYIYDLLKQNINEQRTVSSNYIEDTQSSILQRYFLISFTYNFKSSFSKNPNK